MSSIGKFQERACNDAEKLCFICSIFIRFYRSFSSKFFYVYRAHCDMPIAMC